LTICLKNPKFISRVSKIEKEDTMIIVLDKEYSGSQKVDAFCKAAMSNVSNMKWVIKKYPKRKDNLEKYALVNGHLELTPPEKVTVSALRSYFARSWKGLFFSEMVDRWEYRYPAFVLSNVTLEAFSNEVEIRVGYPRYDEIDEALYVTEVHGREWEKIRPEFEKFVSNFMEELRKESPICAITSANSESSKVGARNFSINKLKETTRGLQYLLENQNPDSETWRLELKDRIEELHSLTSASLGK
jgi:hypothetical protein